MSSNNLNILMQKLYSLEENISDQTENQSRSSSSSDQFNVIKQAITETLNSISLKIIQKNEKISKDGRTPDVIKMEVRIKDKVLRLDKHLIEMNEVIRQQKRDHKKYTKSDLEVKEKQYSNLLAQPREIKLREKDENIHQKQVEMKTNLFSNQGSQERKDSKESEASPKDQEALERFAKTDADQNRTIDEINNGLKRLLVAASDIEQQTVRQTEVIIHLDRELDTACEDLESSNKSLKEVLTNYRKPSKFCLDTCLLFVLLGLISTIAKLC